MSAYMHPGCTVRHRSWRTLAACMVPRAEWVSGEGRWGLVAGCPPLTVSLYATEADVLAARRDLTDTGCGRTCTGNHVVILLPDFDAS